MGLSAPARGVLELLGAYSARFPIERGKGVLQRAALRLMGISDVKVALPNEIELHLDFPADTGYEQVLFLGTYEPSTTQLLRRLLDPEDVVIDVGANIGWFTLHVARAIGVRRCHAFEPVPELFAKLRRNCELNRVGRRVRLNRLALGSSSGEARLYTFPDLPHGHTSARPARDLPHRVSMAPRTTLDAYLERCGELEVDLVKIDVEGAGLDVIRGARHLLDRPLPPMWILELDDDSARRFGHDAREQIRFLSENGPYGFYRLIDPYGGVRRIRGAEDCVDGDHVLCVPSGREGRLRRLE